MVGIKAIQGTREGGRDGGRKRGKEGETEGGERAQELESVNNYSISVVAIALLWRTESMDNCSISAVVITLLWRTDVQTKASQHVVPLEIYHSGMVPYSWLVKAIHTQCILYNHKQYC